MVPKSINTDRHKSDFRLHPFAKAALTAVKGVLTIVMLIAFLAAGVMGGAVYAYIKTSDDVSMDQLDVDTRGLTSNIYDRDGNITAKLTGKDNQNREVVGHEDIPDYLQKALVAIEDERFYRHKGVDFKRSASAALYYLTGIGHKHGGSTITQQLVKNLTNSFDETPQRKIQEQWAALQLEKRLDKWQIITKYLNMIYMGNGCYGIQSASNTYFGKDVSVLTLAESALLVGIINEPGTYNPFNEEGRKAALERQRLILSKMNEQGYITDNQYNDALTEDIVFADPGENRTTAPVQSYFDDQVISDVIDDLTKEYNITRETAAMRLYNNGYRVYSTQDPHIQKILDEEFTGGEHFWTQNPYAIQYDESPQAAMLVLDPYTGEVLGMYGGAGEKTGSRTFNRATQLKRHSGSSMKPIAVYGPVFDLRLATPATIVDDVPVRMHTDEELKEELYPENFTRKYFGLTDLRTALQKSRNVVAAKVFRDILGADKAVEYLKRAGIDRENERYVSLALGGLEEGLSPMDMAGAYIPFPNRGVYIKPRTYTRVVDKNGEVVLVKRPEYTVVYDESTAWLMVDILKGVTKPGGTAPYCSIGDGESIPAAGKTGTSSFNIDKWFVGFTPYYVAATWYGYDNKVEPISLQEGEERMKAQRIWKAVMERIHENLEPRRFSDPPPGSIEKRYICSYSGKIATELCHEDPRGDAVRLEYFLKGTAPAYDDLCTLHVKAKVCTASQDIWGRDLLACDYCPGETTEERVFIQRPEPYVPEMPDDPYPEDWIYELPAAEYCTEHCIDEEKTEENPAQVKEPQDETP